MLARAGAFDGEMVCLALEGLAMVAAGRVDEGMRRLDEATTAAVSGEIRDARIVEVVCCHLIDACQRVRDFDRAGESIWSSIDWKTPRSDCMSSPRTHSVGRSPPLVGPSDRRGPCL